MPANRWGLRRHRAVLGEAAVVLAVSTVVAVATTWPLALHLNHVAHDPFDPRFQAWTIDWVQHAIRHPGHLYDANIFTPEKATLAYSDSLIGIAVPLLPLRWLGMTPIGELNVAVLAGFVLSAAAAYAFGRVVTHSVVAGAVVAAAFAFGEFGTYEAGHVQTVFRPGVAIAAAAAWVLADRAEQREPGSSLRIPSIVLAAAVAWQFSISFYTGTYALAAGIVVLVVRARSLGRRGALAAGGAVLVAVFFAAALALPYLGRHAALPGFHWSLHDLGPEGADFLHADSRLLVWGRLLGRGRAWPQFPPPLFPGVGLIALGAVGLAGAWRGGTRRFDRRIAVLGVALVVVGAAGALGTSDVGWRQYAPYRLVYDWAPGGQALRATFRGWMIGLLGVGLLAGLGADAVGRSVGSVASGSRPAMVRALVAAFAVLAVLGEGYRHWSGLALVNEQPVDRVLATLPARGGVLYLPVAVQGETPAFFAIPYETDAVYRTTAHHRPTPNGYSGFFPASYYRMTRLVALLPAQPALGYLQRIGVRFVVVRAAAGTSRWARLLRPATASPLRFLGRYGADLLYEVPPSG